MKWTTLIGVLLLAACGVQRPETPEYFEEVTGVSLCLGTTVTNVNQNGAKQAGMGFIYEVQLRMPAECEDKFFSAVERRRAELDLDDVIQTSRKGDLIQFLYAG